MIDTADLAILETYAESTNPVERGFVEEIRRLHDEADDVATLRARVEDLEEELDAVKSELRDATEEVETLTSDVVAAKAAWSEVASERSAAESRLEEFKTSLRELLA